MRCPLRLVVVLGAFVLGCGDGQTTGPKSPEPTPASSASPAPSGKACSLDDATSCPTGQKCVVPSGLPTRNGTCQ